MSTRGSVLSVRLCDLNLNSYLPVVGDVDPGPVLTVRLCDLNLNTCLPVVGDIGPGPRPQCPSVLRVGGSRGETLGGGRGRPYTECRALNLDGSGVRFRPIRPLQ